VKPDLEEDGVGRGKDSDSVKGGVSRKGSLATRRSANKGMKRRKESKGQTHLNYPKFRGASWKQ